MQRGRDKLRKYEFVINVLIGIAGMLPRSFQEVAFQCSRKIGGRLGLLLRYILLKNIACYCGDNVSIHADVYILYPRRLIIGDNVSIHPFCYIDCYGELKIGNDVSIAHSTTVMSSEHNYRDDKINIKDQGVEKKETSIKSNVWVGSGCKVLAGANVSEGCILAAGAVLKGGTKPDYIYGGVPAKEIKSRLV